MMLELMVLPFTMLLLMMLEVMLLSIVVLFWMVRLRYVPPSAVEFRNVEFTTVVPFRVTLMSMLPYTDEFSSLLFVIVELVTLT